MSKLKTYYIVAEDILPEALLKTIKAKELIKKGEVSNSLEAANAMGIARSTYYKYKDGIHTFVDYGAMDITNVFLTLDHTPGILSKVLSTISDFDGNVLTINQSLPSYGVALVTISLGLRDPDKLNSLYDTLQILEGVCEMERERERNLVIVLFFKIYSWKQKLVHFKQTR